METQEEHKSPGLFFDSDNKFIYVYGEKCTERKSIKDPQAPFEIIQQNTNDSHNSDFNEFQVIPIQNEKNEFFMFSGFTFNRLSITEDGKIDKKFHHRLGDDSYYNSNPAVNSNGDIMLLGGKCISILGHYFKERGFVQQNYIYEHGSNYIDRELAKKKQTKNFLIEH